MFGLIFSMSLPIDVFLLMKVSFPTFRPRTATEIVFLRKEREILSLQYFAYFSWAASAPKDKGKRCPCYGIVKNFFINFVGPQSIEFLN